MQDSRYNLHKDVQIFINISQINDKIKEQKLSTIPYLLLLQGIAHNSRRHEQYVVQTSTQAAHVLRQQPVNLRNFL